MSSIKDIKDIEEILSQYTIKKEVIKPNRNKYYINPDKLREAIESLKRKLGEESLYLSTIVGVDKIEEGVIEINYFLHIIPLATTIDLAVKVPRNNPKVPTIIDILPAAYAGECEAYDLLGVEFIGNNYLKRGFFVPADIASKGIYPLRKDAKV